MVFFTVSADQELFNIDVTAIFRLAGLVHNLLLILFKAYGMRGVGGLMD